MQSHIQAQKQATQFHRGSQAASNDQTMPDALPKIPVLILGSYITALGAMRSIASAGIDARCITAPDNFVRVSRWYKPPPNDVDFVKAIEDLPVYLRKLSLETAVLMPCSDEWVAAVAGLDPELTARFPSSRPSPETLAFFLDKGKLEHKLETLGVQRPHTILLESEADLEPVGGDKYHTLFLKPRCSREFFLGFGVKAFHLHSVEQAADLFARCQKCGFKVMLQEYIPGPANRHYFIDGFVDRHGVIRAVFARQRIRMYPLDFGDSSYVTTVPVETVAQAIDSLKKLLPDLKYRGIFSAEFKVDDRDKCFKLIEVNTRPWTYIDFDSKHGMNMAVMAYRDALGLDVPTVTEYDIGASMIYLPNDLRAGWILFRRGELSMLKWIASCFTARSAVFSFSDPLPSLTWWWNVFLGLSRRLFSGRKAVK